MNNLGLIAGILANVGAVASAASPVLAARPAIAAPHATGTISVNIATGRMNGAICVANWPREAVERFVLNGGFNLATVTDGAGKKLKFEGYYAGEMDGESRIYTLPALAGDKLCFTYVGAFPVYTQRDHFTDFKGLIAFNGESVRATEQSAWLPLPYDPERKKRIDRFTHAIEFRCEGCTVVYINGSQPAPASRATFSSALPRPPLLFAGRGPTSSVGSITFLNASPQPENAAALSREFEAVANWYAAYLRLPYRDRPTFLAVEPVETYPPNRNWGFVSWPTVAFAGVSFDDLGKALLGRQPQDEWVTSFLAHEAGHYYFGALQQPHGPYAWFLLESTAEYLGFVYLRDRAGEQAAARRTAMWQKAIDETKDLITPFDQIDDQEEIGGVYRYSYGPLLLLSMERWLGEKKVRSFLRTLLAVPSPESWSDLTALALKSGIKRREWESWRQACVAGASKRCMEH